MMGIAYRWPLRGALPPVAFGDAPRDIWETKKRGKPR